MKVKALKKYLIIYWLKVKISFMVRMAYPANFFILLLAVVGQGFISVLLLSVIYKYAKNLSGWTYEQALLVVASYLIVEGLMWLSSGNMGGLRRTIRTGTLDQILIKPANKLFLVTIWRIDPEDALRLVVAGFVLHLALTDTHMVILNWVLASVFYVALIACAFITYYSISLMVNCLFFWFIEVGALGQLLENFMRIGQYPVDILYSKTMRIILSTIIPLAFISTVPAKAFIYQPNFKTLFLSVAVASISFFIALKVWHAGLKAYSSASS